jgi:hypothetical protein
MSFCKISSKNSVSLKSIISFYLISLLFILGGCGGENKSGAQANASDGIVRPQNFIMGIASHIGTMYPQDHAAWRNTDNKSIQQIAITELHADSLRDELLWRYLGDSPDNEQTERVAPAIARFKEVGGMGGKILLILDYSHPDWITYGFPATRDQRQAFARYAHRAINAIGPENLAGIEIWNEWDNWMAWTGSKPEVWNTPCPLEGDDTIACAILYAKLVEALVNPEVEGLSTPSLRKLSPKVPIIVGATLSFNPQWTQPMLEYLRENHVQVDGYSIHPYGTAGDINGCYVDWNVTPLDEGKAQCVKGASERVAEWYGQELPIYVTELGFTTGKSADPKPNASDITPELQAELLVKSYVRTRAVDNVQGIWWYDLIQDYAPQNAQYPYGQGTNEWENGYGLVSRIGDYAAQKAGETRPAGFAYAALAVFWKECSNISGDINRNRYFQLDCTDGKRHIFLDATIEELKQAQANGGILVDLLGVKGNVERGTAVPTDWAGGQVGVYGGNSISLGMRIEGKAYSGQTVTAVINIPNIDRYEWKSKCDMVNIMGCPLNWEDAAYISLDPTNPNYTIRGWAGNWDDFQGISSIGRLFRVQAIKNNQVASEVYFRPTIYQAAGSAAVGDITSPESGVIRIAGDAWAFDWENINRSGRLYVTIGGDCNNEISEKHVVEANRQWDVRKAAAYPQVQGSLYGFDRLIYTNLRGSKTIYLYPIPSDWKPSDGCGGLGTTLGSANGKAVDIGI